MSTTAIVVWAAVGAAIALSIVLRLIRGPSPNGVTAQIEAAKRRYPAPDRTLSSVVASPGAPAIVRASATSPAEEHSVWLEYLVRPEGRSGAWEADVELVSRAGTDERRRTFTVGYDGEDHRSDTGLVGTTFVPSSEGGSGEDAGNLRLATLPSATAGAPIEVVATIRPRGAVTATKLVVSVRVAPPAS